MATREHGPVLVSIEDVTERKRAALRESEVRYRTPFEDSLVLGGRLFRGKARICGWSRRGCAIFAYFQAHPDKRRPRIRRRWTCTGPETGAAVRGAHRVVPEEAAPSAAEFEAVAHGAEWFETEHLGTALDGEMLTLITKWTAAPGFEQSLARVLVSVVDISERKHLERALRASLEQADRSRRLVLALGAAAQAVQRARTPEEIYQTIGYEVAGLGYQALVLEATADRSHLIVRHTTWEPGVVAAVEAQIGLPVSGFRVPLGPGLLLSDVIARGQSVYARAPVDSVRNVLPEPLKARAQGILEMLDISRTVCAPLGQGDCHGC
jgi:PAS domain-containing protein